MAQPTIIFEDGNLIVIDKPAGLLVHAISDGRLAISDAEASLPGDTLVDWLFEHDPKIKNLNWPDPTRPGIVHRLDRDTSGVMVLAKTPETLRRLQQQFHDRTVQKVYTALVVGSPTWKEYTIKVPISRGEGTKRRAQYLQLPNQSAKAAETVFCVVKRISLESQKSKVKNQNLEVTLIEARPKTGRTHQIRVHLGLLGHPILGDPWYQTKAGREITKQLTVPRLMLHAAELQFIHPATSKPLTIKAPLPPDFTTVLTLLAPKP